MPTLQTLEEAKEHFGKLLERQAARVDAVKQQGPPVDYATLDTIIIGIIGGDGIGPAISAEAQRMLEELLADEVAAGKVEFRVIDGLTIENRAAVGKAIPDDVLAEIKQCHVTLKGPTTTPEQGDEWPNIESANVAMRKELDLFANVRPVRIPADGIDWMFFRENTEDVYAVGSEGLSWGDLHVDFKVLSNPGNDRIIRRAFEFAKANGKTSVTVVNKANVVKTCDGAFLDSAEKIGKVRKVHNELEVGAPISYVARSNDNLLTAKLKSKLLVNAETSTRKVKVATENGVVYLMGMLPRTQADRVVEVARSVFGVQKIIKVFEYTDT